MHFYKFNIGDYASHTRHLSPLEDIAYRRMLDLAYTTEQPLSKDVRQLSRIINMRDHQQEIKDVLEEFWVEVDEGWISGRVLKEIESMSGKSAKAKISAEIRWENFRKAKALREESERNANASENCANVPEIDATHYTLPTTHYTLPTTQDNPPEVITTTQTNSTCMPSQTAPTPKKATRLPANWILPKAWGDWALAEKPELTPDDVRVMAETFKDHWIANASRATGKKDDWQATWRNWVRRNHPNRSGVPKPNGRAYHEKITDTVDQIFGRKRHGAGNTIIDITPSQATGSDAADIPAICTGIRAAGG